MALIPPAYRGDGQFAMTLTLLVAIVCIRYTVYVMYITIISIAITIKPVL